MGLLRIVGGEHKGRYLRVPPGRAVRPTKEKVREAVFDVLGDVGGLAVLDVFAGSGALGLEALSRGAAWCTFIEREKRVCATLRENISILGLEKVSEVIVANYSAGLDLVERAGRRYDLIFVDPPYSMMDTFVRKAEPKLLAILSPGGRAVVEGPRNQDLVLMMQRVFCRSYGDTTVHIVERREEDQ